MKKNLSCMICDRAGVIVPPGTFANLGAPYFEGVFREFPPGKRLCPDHLLMLRRGKSLGSMAKHTKEAAA